MPPSVVIDLTSDRGSALNPIDLTDEDNSYAPSATDSNEAFMARKALNLLTTPDLKSEDGDSFSDDIETAESRPTQTHGWLWHGHNSIATSGYSPYIKSTILDLLRSTAESKDLPGGVEDGVKAWGDFKTWLNIPDSTVLDETLASQYIPIIEGVLTASLDKVQLDGHSLLVQTIQNSARYDGRHELGEVEIEEAKSAIDGFSNRLKILLPNAQTPAAVSIQITEGRSLWIYAHTEEEQRRLVEELEGLIPSTIQFFSRRKHLISQVRSWQSGISFESRLDEILSGFTMPFHQSIPDLRLDDSTLILLTQIVGLSKLILSKGVNRKDAFGRICHSAKLKETLLDMKRDLLPVLGGAEHELRKTLMKKNITDYPWWKEESSRTFTLRAPPASRSDAANNFQGEVAGSASGSDRPARRSGFHTPTQSHSRPESSRSGAASNTIHDGSTAQTPRTPVNPRLEVNTMPRVAGRSGVAGRNIDNGYQVETIDLESNVAGSSNSNPGVRRGKRPVLSYIESGSLHRRRRHS